jgi:hypothetical protein
MPTEWVDDMTSLYLSGLGVLLVAKPGFGPWLRASIASWALGTTLSGGSEGA